MFFACRQRFQDSQWFTWDGWGLGFNQSQKQLLMGMQELLRIGRGSIQSNEMKSAAIPKALLTVVRSLTSSCLYIYIIYIYIFILQKTYQGAVTMYQYYMGPVWNYLSFYTVWHHPQLSADVSYALQNLLTETPQHCLEAMCQRRPTCHRMFVALLASY